MNCNEFRGKIGLYCSEEISDGLKAKAEEHLASCETCRKLTDQEQALIQDLGILGTGDPDKEHYVENIMKTVREMPLPGVLPQETSLVWRVCYTLYNAMAVGVMFAALFIIYFSGFVSFDQFTFLPEARTAFLGGVLIIVGCIFIILQGKELTVWFAARVKQLSSFQVAPDSILMFAAGLCLWITGSVLLFSAVF